MCFSYGLAIVGINITGVAYDLLMKGYLKTHFYNVVQGKPKLEHFNTVYCKCHVTVDNEYLDLSLLFHIAHRLN